MSTAFGPILIGISVVIISRGTNIVYLIIASAILVKGIDLMIRGNIEK